MPGVLMYFHCVSMLRFMLKVFSLCLPQLDGTVVMVSVLTVARKNQEDRLCVSELLTPW